MRTTIGMGLLAALLLVTGNARAEVPPDGAEVLAQVAAMGAADAVDYAAARDALVAEGDAVVPALRRLARIDGDWRVAAAAAAAVGWIEHGDRYAEFVASAARVTAGGRLRYVEANGPVDGALVPLLVERLVWTERDAERRAAVAGVLERAGDPRTVEALAWALAEDPSAEVRQAAAGALAKVDGEAATAALIEALPRLSAGGDRAAVAGLLGWRADAAAVPALLDVLTGDVSSTARARAARGLGWIGAAEADEALRAALRDDPDAEVRGQAALALGRVAGEASRGALEQAAAGDPDAEVARLAGAALTRLQEAAR